MNAREFQQSQFFDNILMSSIRFLDALPAKTPNEKSQFMRGLPKILDQFPKSVLDKKVLPALLEETKDKELLSLVLQNIFKIIKIIPSGKRAMTEKILPQLRETFLAGAGKERDTAKEAGLAVILENIELIGDNCDGKEFKTDIMPILQLGLESPTHTIVDKSLSCIPTIMKILDFTTIKNEVFPVVAAVFSKTSSLGIKVRGLEAFVVLCGGSPTDDTAVGDGLDGAIVGSRKPKQSSTAVLDKYTVQEKVVPLLKAMKTKEPAVMMAALAVFQQVGKIADTEFLAMEALPILWSFSLGPLLNLQQFQQFMDLIKKISSKIENEQIRKLRDLSSSGTNATLKTNDFVNAGSTNGFFNSNGSDDVGEDDFQRLVLGRGNQNSGDMLGDAIRPQPQSSKQPEAPSFSWSSTPVNAAHSHQNSMSNVLQPQSRTITPDQSLSSFATLSPASSRPTTNTMSNGISSFTPMQPMQPSMAPMQPNMMQPTPPMASGWSSHIAQPMQPSQPSFSMPPPQPQHNFSMPPPPQPQPVTPFSAFSLPPPPITPAQRPGVQTQNSGYFGGAQSSTGQAQTSMKPPGQKTGLDKYESLI
jgi:SCY1-like protein 2